MTLAAILVVYFLGLVCPRGVSASTAQDQEGRAASQAQAAPAQSAGSLPASGSPAHQSQNSPSPSPKQHNHHTKAGIPDCSNSPAPLTPGGGSPPTGAANNDSTSVGSGNAQSAQAGSNTSTAMAKPCPPHKVVVKNGGSDEPNVALKGDTSAEKALYERSTTEQLAAGTEENLKKIAGRQLTPSQREMISQVKQFMAQSKAAVAAGDLERGQNLAVKAHLLSDELLKP